MRKDKLLAIKLRKQGKSYNQISQVLKIPKGTLSYWFGNLKISSKAQEKILKRTHQLNLERLIKRNKNQTVLAKERALIIRAEAKQESISLMNEPLFLSGLSLYWAEGYKKGADGSKWKSVSFANSDPDMIKVIMKFFRKFLVYDDRRIKIQLMAHKNISIDNAITFWSDLTKIPKKQFIKSYVGISKASKGKREPNRLTHGTIHIKINDVKLFFRVIGWIDGLKSKI